MATQMKTRKLPGSGPDETGGGGAGVGGRLTADEWGALGEVAAWWRNRLAVGDSTAPLESHFGGVDLAGTARTVGLAPAAVDFGRPLLPTATGATATGGAALLVMAFGVPDSMAGGEVYSLVGLCHVFDAGEAGWFSRYVTLARAPTTATSVELRTAAAPDGGAPAMLLVGAPDVTIDWRVEALRLER